MRTIPHRRLGAKIGAFTFWSSLPADSRVRAAGIRLALGLLWLVGLLSSPTAGAQTYKLIFNKFGVQQVPGSKLVQGSDGDFYGTSSSGGSNGYGTVFKVSPSGTLTTLVNFTFDHDAGGRPYAGLVQGSDGNFYGTTANGGGWGTVYKVSPSGTLTKLVNFTRALGGDPYGGLMQGSDGNFYGTTITGGSSNSGTVFKVSPSGTLTTLANFPSGIYGAEAWAKLVQSSDGDFYGTTANGGSSNKGTVFKVSSDGTLTTLVNFTGVNGRDPYTGLIQGSDGDFYGTTHQGGSSGKGTVYKVSSNGTLTTLVNFTGVNGAYPEAELVQGSDGNFYGTTSSGGSSDKGTVFKVSSTGTLTTLFSFYDNAQGAFPHGTPIFGADGNLYGTAGTAIYRLNVVPTVTTGAAAEISPTSATVAGTVNANGADSTVLFEYGLTTAYGSVVTATPATVGAQAGTTSVGATLTGLAPHTLYHYRVKAVNSLGTSYGADASFTTLNTLPVTSVDAVSTHSAAVSIAVLANDSDADGDSLSIVSFTQGTQGTVTQSGSNLIYTPGASFAAALGDSFTYVADDGFGGSATGTVTITKSNTTPVTSSDSGAYDGHQTVTVDVLANDSDLDGDTLTITAVTDGAAGTVTTNGAVLFYKPGADFFGSDSFNYTVIDGFGGTSVGVVTIRSLIPISQFLAKGSTAGRTPSEGDAVPCEPAGVTFKNFGVPSINDEGRVAFLTTITAPVGSVPAVYDGNAIVARKGDAAPASGGLRFEAFTDPALNRGGAVAFLSRLEGLSLPTFFRERFEPENGAELKAATPDGDPARIAVAFAAEKTT